MCWIFFAAAGFGFYKTTEDAPFSAAGHVHPLLRDTHLAVQVVAVIASATVLLGALPLIAAALAHARRDRGVRRVVGLPFVPVIAFAVLTVAVIAIARAHTTGHVSTAGFGMAVVWGIAGLACGAGCVVACRAALFAVPVSSSRLRSALACGTLVTIAMVAITAATALYAVALAVDASDLAASANGPFGMLSTAASLALAAVVMVAFSVLAAITTRRGWRVAGQLDSPAPS